MSKPITNEEFVKKGDCPWCGSKDVQYSPNVTFMGDFINQELDCLSCGAAFSAIYTLTGYEEGQ